MTATTNQKVIFSPHCDDAFLALGGYILNDPTSIHVVDIFATCAWTTSPENFSAEELTRINQAEEKRVAVNAKVSLTLYEYPEALLRNYRKWNAKLVHPEDTAMANEIAQTMRQHISDATHVFFPLAPGHHVDHAIVHAQLHNLFDEMTGNNSKVYVYEDLPYSWYGDVNEQIEKLSRRFNLEPEIIDISESFNEKLALLGQYKSQLATSDIQKVTEYAQSISPVTYSERIWRVTKR
ncbi:MAG: PIG-L family deacetylase [Candidatus Microsaccharimonas sp.]